MAELAASTADSLVLLNAAVLNSHALRKGEFDNGMYDKADIDHTHDQLHDAMTVLDGATVNLTLVGQQVTAEVIRGTNSGLQVLADGIGVEFGTGENQVARGNHTHAQLHDVATGSTTQTAVVTVTGQQISATVTLASSGGLKTDDGVYGLSCDFGTAADQVARGDHTHGNVSTVTAGFMSPEDKIKLDNLDGGEYGIQSLTQTASITLTFVDNDLKAELNLGTGLVLDVPNNQVNVDVSLFAESAHTHDNATTGAAGFMSAADKTRLDELDNGAYGLETASDTQTVNLTLLANDLSADVRLKSTGGITYDSDGLKLDFGTTTNQPARGDHTHALLHESASGGSSQTTTVSVTANQVVTADVVLQVSGGLKVDDGVYGIACDFGTSSTQVARGNHIHDAATTSVAGFMSASDKQKLDAFDDGGYGIISGILDTKTVNLSITSSILQADVKAGAGLKEGDADNLEVDFTLVAEANHVHSSATTSVAGFLSAADKTKLDALAAGGTTTYDARYVKADGSNPMTGALTLPGNPTTNLQAATKQYVDLRLLKTANLSDLGDVATARDNIGIGYTDSVLFGALGITDAIAISPTAASANDPYISLAISTQRITLASGTPDFTVFAGATMVYITGALNVGNNGWKQVVEIAETYIELTPGSITDDESATGSIVVTIYQGVTLIGGARSQSVLTMEEGASVTGTISFDDGVYGLITANSGAELFRFGATSGGVNTVSRIGATETLTNKTLTDAVLAGTSLTFPDGFKIGAPDLDAFHITWDEAGELVTLKASLETYEFGAITSTNRVARFLDIGVAEGFAGLDASSNLFVGSANTIGWTSRTRMRSPADGDLLLLKNDDGTYGNIHTSQVRIKGASLALSGGVATVDFTSSGRRNLTIDADATFAGSNYLDEATVGVNITCDGTPRTLAFDSNWVFICPKPTSIAASKRAWLTLHCTSNAATGVRATYTVEP